MLRPYFTRLLFQRLNEGKSINLIGLPLSGCSECLYDVKMLAVKKGIVTVYLDMKDFKYNYQGLLKSTHEQLTVGSIEAKNALPESTQNLAIVVSDYTNLERNTFILLDHFADILDNPEQRLPKSFFDDLNSLRNRTDIAICCVTDKPHLHCKYYFEDGKGKINDTLSWLDLDPLLLPNLLDEEAAAAFDNHLENHPLWPQEKVYRTAYIRVIQGNLHPVGILRAISVDWDQHPAPIDIEHRLKRITHNFEALYLRRPKKPTGLYQRFKKEITDWVKIIKDTRG